MILLSLLAFADNEDSKIKEGQIISGDKGDAVCYLTIKAKDGSIVSEMADIKLCYPDYSGTFSTFVWKKVKVIATSCKGDPNCASSSSIWIIDDATPLWSVSIKDNENGSSVLQAKSGAHSYSIDIPLGGCFTEKEPSNDFFYKRECDFAGKGGSIALLQSLEKGLQVVMEIHDEKGTAPAVIWTEPQKLGTVFRK